MFTVLWSDIYDLVVYEFEFGLLAICRNRPCPENRTFATSISGSVVPSAQNHTIDNSTTKHIRTTEMDENVEDSITEQTGTIIFKLFRTLTVSHGIIRRTLQEQTLYHFNVQQEQILNTEYYLSYIVTVLSIVSPITQRSNCNSHVLFTDEAIVCKWFD